VSQNIDARATMALAATAPVASLGREPTANPAATATGMASTVRPRSRSRVVRASKGASQISLR
jgi:hypothetical protein